MRDSPDTREPAAETDAQAVPSAPTPRRHILTVALEDYFHVGAFNRLIQRGQWYRFETRLEHNTLRTLDLLERHDVKATFFVLGWVADHFPELIRMVAERGHEIASKGYYHRGIRQMAPAEFREDLARAREALERAAATRVVGYRVAHEWFSPTDLWALDVLAEEGYAYDSSISPTLRRYSAEPWRRFVHRHAHGDRSLWEFPLSTWNFMGWTFSIAGGNYFRQFPHWFMKWAVGRWHRRYAAPFVMYFHVWELDAEQPRINAASFLTRVRHYRNLDKMAGRLEHYLGKYRFTAIADYLGLDTHQSPRPHRGEDEAGQPRATDPRREAAGRVAVLPGAGATGTTKKTKASVVVPCFNEELTVHYLANTLASVRARLADRYDLQLILVDDCSVDGTWDALQNVFGPLPGCKVIRHERNLGVAGAILTGIRHADNEIVCSIDCDCSYDPHEIAHMIPLLADGVDLVTASPYHPQGQVRNVPAWRLTISKGASFLYRRVLRQKLHTYTSCFRVYRRSAVLNLKVTETAYLGIAETLARLDLQGSRIVEYPATLDIRVFGRSKIKVVKTTLGHLGLLVRLLAARLLGQTKPLPAPASGAPGQDAPHESASNPVTTQPERRSV